MNNLYDHLSPSVIAKIAIDLCEVAEETDVENHKSYAHHLHEAFEALARHDGLHSLIYLASSQITFDYYIHWFSRKDVTPNE